MSASRLYPLIRTGNLRTVNMVPAMPCRVCIIFEVQQYKLCTDTEHAKQGCSPTFGVLGFRTTGSSSNRPSSSSPRLVYGANDQFNAFAPLRVWVHHITCTCTHRLPLGTSCAHDENLGGGRREGRRVSFEGVRRGARCGPPGYAGRQEGLAGLSAGTGDGRGGGGGGGWAEAALAN